MLMVIPNSGKIAWLGLAICDGAVLPEEWSVELYSNDVSPGDTSVVASFTPATFDGYFSVAINRDNFPLPTIVANVAETTSFIVPVFTCTGGAPQTVYGWFMRGVDSDICYAAQRFDTPRVMSVGAVEALDPFKIKLKTFS